MPKFFAIFLPMLAFLISMFTIYLVQKNTNKPMNKKVLLILLGFGILLFLICLGIFIF